MAITMKRYVDIGSTVLNALEGERDFSALAFSTSAMKTSVPTAYASTKTDYVAGKAVSLTKEGVEACFDSTTDAYKFAMAYFGYTSLTGRSPAIVNLAIVGEDDTALSRFNEVTSEFVNFGTFTFVGSSFTLGTVGSGGLLDVAKANEGFGKSYLFVMAVTASNAESVSEALTGTSGTHLVLGPSTEEYVAWMPCAWAASINYSAEQASSTLMYKQFGGATATVTDDANATTYDGLRVNYVGLVQTRASIVKFYQTGVNTDGLDAGVYLDSVWITSQIESGWIGLATNRVKIPANSDGCSIVRAMILDIAEQAIRNGCILVDKPLNDQQIAEVNSYAGNTSAATVVQTSGYYINAIVVFENNKYVLKYTLIYGKGDHISKIVGTHILV